MHRLVFEFLYFQILVGKDLYPPLPPPVVRVVIRCRISRYVPGGRPRPPLHRTSPGRGRAPVMGNFLSQALWAEARGNMGNFLRRALWTEARGNIIDQAGGQNGRPV